ncbi:MAG TPA: PKD domain-containing protein, partial [Bacteroidia bacterium]|nr:PKD domain-containing protein [Bacteroidia bacterium]
MTRKFYSAISFSALLLLCGNLHSQTAVWKQPMDHPEMSFYQIQQQFNHDMRFKQREIEREQRRESGQQTSAGKGVSGQQGAESEEDMESYVLFKRWEDFMAPRVYPSGDITLPSTTWDRFQDYLNSNPAAMGQYQQGNGNSNQRTANPQNSIMTSTWTFAGPTGAPSGAGPGGGGAGRVNFLRFDPTNTNILWVGAPAGGLWKSTNGGSSWTTNTDFLTVVGATDVVIDPTNTQVMYLATGDGDAGDTYSIGVMKSTDGGSTWNTTGLNWTVNQGRVISKLLINPSNPQIIMAFSNAGIWRTTNGGTSWTQVSTASVKDGEFMPGTPNTVYACGTRFYKSTDGGVTWTNITSGLPANTSVDRMAIAVTAANSAYIYMVAGSAANDGFYGFYKSTNSGTSFTQVTVSSPSNILGWASAGNDTGGQGWYDLSIDADPTNANAVIVGGVNVWRTTNGGTSWTLNAQWTGSGAPFIHADVHSLNYLPGSGSTYFATSDGGVFKTTNTGGAWSDLSNNLCIAQPYRIGLSGSNANIWITGHQDNGTNIKNGATYGVTMGGDGMDCFIDRTNNNVMYGEQYQGSLNRTTNGGASWSGITSGLSGTAPWVTPWYQDPSVANTIYCGRTNLFKSTNQGTSWSQLTALPASPSGTIVDFKVAPSNNQVIYVARATGLFKTTNGGTSWTTVTGTLPVGSASISRVDVKPNDPNTVYVTFSGYSSGNKVFKTSNGGTSWTNISTGLPNLPVNCVRFDPSGSATEAVYVGCDVGVYYMDNSFTSWQPYFTALPNAPVYDLEIYAATGKLRAATYGRGVWETDIYNPGTLPPVAQFTANTQIVCAGNPVQFTDQSSFNPTSWSWTFQGGSPATSTSQNPTVTYSAPGTYSVSLTATNANGSNTNNQVSYITVLGSQSPPLVEGFEAATFLPTGWTAKNINNDGIFWAQASVGYNSTKSAMFDNYNNDVAGAQDEMWAPRLDCSSYSTLSLTFDVAYAPYDLVTYCDSLEVLVSTDCGTTWNSVYLKGGSTLETVAPQTTAFTPTNAQWRNDAVNLNTYAGQSSVLIVFRNRGHYGNILYVDNINITGTAAAIPNGNFTASVTSACAGTPVNFTDASSGTPTSWTWTFPSGTPASSTSQNVTGVVWNTAGTYTVTHTATNASGTGTTTQTITILPSPTVTITPSGTSVCSGNSVTLTGGGASTYAWMPGSLSGSPVTVTPASTTTYTLTGTAANGCSSTATQAITVNATPTVTATASPATVCSGSSSSLTGSGASTYSWMPGSLSGSPVSVTPGSTTTYTVTGTAANGCTNTATRTVTVNPTPTVTATASQGTICNGSSTTLTASGATSYTWMPGSLSGTSVSVSPASTTTYTVTGTSGTCSNTATLTITVNPSPTVTTTASPATICSGSSSTLTASGATSYTWMPGSLSGSPVSVTPGSTTTYTVTGTAANGCTNTATRTVTVNPTPTVTATASSSSICTGNSVTLSATGATTYNWMPGNHNGQPWTTTPASTTTYTVTGTSGGCSSTSTVTVIVGAPPVVTASASNPSICTGGSSTLTGSGAATYTWMPGSLSGTSVSVSPTSNTTYTVTGSSGPGCSSTATVSVSVNPLPTVTASASSTTICNGDSTVLTGSGASTYSWMPGNLSGSSVTVNPTSTTTYTVTGTSASGCSATA